MTRQVDVGGISIAYDVVGSGPLLLLLHGFTGDGTTMAGLAHSLSDLRTVLTPDLVGHGRSSSPHDIAHYRMSAVVEQLVAVVAAEGNEPADVIGYSLGGRVALSLALEQPSSVRSVTTVGASPGLQGEERAARIADDEALATAIERDGVPAFVDRWMALPMWRSLQARIGANAWAASREQRLRGSAVGLANSLRGLGTGAMPPMTDRLDTLRVPIHLIAGAEDVKFADMAQRMAGHIDDAEVTLVAEAGHAAHLEQPERVVDAVRRFLR